MIAGIFHPGSGLGNQLHRYIATRVLALDNGYHFSMVAPENFKGKSFMNLDMGESIDWPHATKLPEGKVYLVSSPLDNWEEKTPYYNPEFNFIKDNTIIDGEFQDERYFEHRLHEIDKWLKVEPIDVPNDVCVIGFRGGEFALFQDLFLTLEYWGQAVDEMREVNPNMVFEVHTDDALLAKEIFPDFKVIHDIGINWRSMRCAKYAIVANSSFYILPRLLKHADGITKGDNIFGKLTTTIAPRYWARRNTKEWSMPQNYYKSFKYI